MAPEWVAVLILWLLAVLKPLPTAVVAPTRQGGEPEAIEGTRTTKVCAQGEDLTSKTSVAILLSFVLPFCPLIGV